MYHIHVTLKVWWVSQVPVVAAHVLAYPSPLPAEVPQFLHVALI